MAFVPEHFKRNVHVGEGDLTEPEWSNEDHKNWADTDQNNSSNYANGNATILQCGVRIIIALVTTTGFIFYTL
jgi:hypothetical protein